MDWRFLRNVLLKALALALVINFAFAAVYPLDGLGKISLYNVLFKGRLRFPFGENPQETYNFSLYNLEAMFQSLALDGAPKTPQEYRVVVIGDSATWGTLLRPEETLAGQLNALAMTSCDGRTLKFYNLGYPTLSLTKDVMILQEAMRYQPDLILWPVTLESFPKDRQLESPLVMNNPVRIQSLDLQYGLGLDMSEETSPDFWQRTLAGERRSLADLIRLQLYGPLWSATGIDQLYPSDYTPAARDLDPDRSFDDKEGPQLAPDDLAWDVLKDGWKIAGDTPILLVNEPILVSGGQNSDLRYNFYYPRWAYDQYRQQLDQAADQNGWNYLDTWDAVPESEFTNSAIHMTPFGVSLLTQVVSARLAGMTCSQP